VARKVEKKEARKETEEVKVGKKEGRKGGNKEKEGKEAMKVRRLS